ncbi:MAG: amidase [Actinobacteria bacterium]|nr:amidase [Actinomycetota bacterium]
MQTREPSTGIFLARPEFEPAGRRLAVKDLFDTEGLTTTYGSVLFADHVPAQTAEAVQRLERAGYADIGKTNLHEFAWGTTSVNPHFGAVPNPAAPGRIAGGSSGGNAAALAAGLADAALGTDSGGSIRIPAACCGVVGFKPTYGLVPLDGAFPLAPSFDHAGPMARSVGDCAAMMETLVPGFRRADPPSPSELRVGVAWLELAEPLIRERVERAAAVFSRARQIAFPDPRRGPEERAFSPVFQREVLEVHSGLFPDYADSYGPDVRAKLEAALEISDRELAMAERYREDLRDRCAQALEGLDLLVTPTLTRVAPPVAKTIDVRPTGDPLVLCTSTFNALGWPALALPCGPAEDGLPASVQIVGRAGEDALVLAAGEVVERALAVAGDAMASGGVRK